MNTNHSILWYQHGPEFRDAFLYNLRDDDVREGGRIARGTIILGAVGLVAAEDDVIGWAAPPVAFHPNRRCKWEGFDLPCMVHPDTPSGKVSSRELRRFNYIVAAMTSDDVAKRAAEVNLPVVVDAGGNCFLNLEIARFEIQGKNRRATLLP